MSQMPDKSASHDMLTAKLERTPLEYVEAIAADHFGFVGRAAVLSSERDETFLMEAADGRRTVLKIANSAEHQDVLEFQTNALLHLERKKLPLPLPRALPASDGRFLLGLDVSGERRLVRMLTFLDGIQLYRVARSQPQMLALGADLAILGQGLADFQVKVPSQDLLWDISNASALRPRTIHVDPGHRDLVLAALDGFDRLASRGMGELRRQVIHNDFNPHNILVAPNDPSIVSGVIDFGDLVEAPLINDLAVALAYQVGNDRGMEMISAMLHAYHAVRPLSRNEIDALPCLLRTRLAMTVIIPEWRAGLHPENRDYILRNQPLALAGLTRLANHSDGEIAAFFRQNLGDLA